MLGYTECHTPLALLMSLHSPVSTRLVRNGRSQKSLVQNAYRIEWILLHIMSLLITKSKLLGPPLCLFSHHSTSTNRVSLYRPYSPASSEPHSCIMFTRTCKLNLSLMVSPHTNQLLLSYYRSLLESDFLHGLGWSNLHDPMDTEGSLTSTPNLAEPVHRSTSLHPRRTAHLLRCRIQRPRSLATISSNACSTTPGSCLTLLHLPRDCSRISDDIWCLALYDYF